MRRKNKNSNKILPPSQNKCGAEFKGSLPVKYAALDHTCIVGIMPVLYPDLVLMTWGGFAWPVEKPFEFLKELLETDKFHYGSC